MAQREHVTPSSALELFLDAFDGMPIQGCHELRLSPQELAELTGKAIWRSRARALWYNGIQLISDGTLVVNGRVRPAGSQDESVRHTRWGRPDKRIFVPSEWLVNWTGSFREVALDRLENWDALR